jgi:hypothetical protein
MAAINASIIISRLSSPLASVPGRSAPHHRHFINPANPKTKRTSRLTHFRTPLADVWQLAGISRRLFVYFRFVQDVREECDDEPTDYASQRVHQ